MSTLHEFDLVVRLATIYDLDRVIDFYKEASRKNINILPRPAKDYESSIHLGLFYIVEDKNYQIVAGAGAFQMDDPRDFVAPLEFGSAYTNPKFENLGIQSILLKIRLAATILFYWHESLTIYTAVKPTNSTSRNNTRKIGFASLEDIPQKLLEPCIHCPTPPDTKSGRMCCCDFSQIHHDGICKSIRDLMGFYPVYKSENSKKGMTIYIHLDETFRESGIHQDDEDVNYPNYWEALQEFLRDSCGQ